MRTEIYYLNYDGHRRQSVRKRRAKAMLATKKNNLILFSALAVVLCRLAAGLDSHHAKQTPAGIANSGDFFRLPIIDRALRAFGFGPRLYSGGLDHEGHSYADEPYDRAPANSLDSH
jgi:hypothetical protein